MSSFLALLRRGALPLLAALLAACQAQPPAEGAAPAPPAAAPSVLHFAAAYPWDAALQCASPAAPASCLLAVIEHEADKVTLHQIDGRSIRRLAEYPVATHPDGVAWLAPGLFAAAVEMSYGLDFFRWDGTRITRIAQVPVGFTPRGITVLSAAQGRYRLLATPYDGDKVALVDWAEGEAPRVTPLTWCREPWHPVVAQRIPGLGGAGVVVACRRDKRVVAIPVDNMASPPVTLASFDDAPRRVMLSPSGRWLYVALELGGRNARIDMRTGELQWLASSPQGSYTAALLDEDTVVWGQSARLLLQRLDGQGRVIEARTLPVAGFIANVLLQELDGDGAIDAVVLAESSHESTIVYGPLWSAATPLH
jgi:hypothetical protein